MYILGQIIKDESIIGISPIMQSSTKTGGNVLSFLVYTMHYPVSFETRAYFAGLANDEREWNEVLTAFPEEHKRAADHIARLIDEELYLESQTFNGVKKAAKEAASNLNG